MAIGGRVWRAKTKSLRTVMREATHLGLWGFKPFFVNFASDVFGSNGICSTPSAHSGTHDPHIPVVEKNKSQVEPEFSTL